MPAPASLRRLAHALGIVALLLIPLLFVIGDYTRRLHSIERHTAIGATDAAGASVRPAGDTREIVFPISSMDAHWWVLHAEQLAAERRSVRHTFRDNPPEGREVHWSTSISLGLAGLAWLLPHITETPARDSLSVAALWLGPLLLALVLVGLFFLTRRRIGLSPALVLIATLGTAPAFLAGFAPGEADHHGIAITAALLSIWPLVLGAGQRRAFAAAGITGGVALWISAATAIPVLVAIAGGALLAACLRRSSPPTTDHHIADPTHWSAWGRWGAATSLLFYALEYLPHHAGLRLEVNHPLHALAWWGGSACLARIVRRIEKTDTSVPPVPPPPPRPWLGALHAAAALAPLLLAGFGGDRFFVLRDPLLWALHRDYIHEFQSLPSALAGDAGWLALPWLWLVVIPAGLALYREFRSRSRALAPLAMLFVPACVALALTCAQIRWQGLASVLCAGLAAALWAHRPPSHAFRIVFPVFLACTVLQFPVFTLLQRAREPAPPDRAELASLVVRDVAWALHSATDPRQAVVLSGPTTSTQLAYFGGFRVLGTLYWENLTGLRAAAAIFGTPDTDAALRLCRQHGVTHLVLFSWDDFGAAYARLHRLATEGIDAPEPAPGSLARLLAENRLPTWLRPLDYDIPPSLGLTDQRVQIYEVRPDQSPADASLHLIDQASNTNGSKLADFNAKVVKCAKRRKTNICDILIQIHQDKVIDMETLTPDDPKGATGQQEREQAGFDAR